MRQSDDQDAVFSKLKIRNGCLNTFCDFQSAAGGDQNFVEFVSVIWKSEKTSSRKA